jgi:hypothetical protein
MDFQIRYPKFAPKPLPVPPFGKGGLGGIKCSPQTPYPIGKGAYKNKKKKIVDKNGKLTYA